MKAIVIASLVFFSLRAMSAEVGQQSTECPYAVQQGRDANPKNVVDTQTTETEKPAVTTKSK